MNNHKNNSGFTLIEMMVTVAIVGIFASIALPSFSRLIESNRINTATNELVSNLHLARSEALKRSNTVTLCPSTNQNIANATCKDSEDYSTGWIVFLDCDGNGERDLGTVTDCGANKTEEIIKVRDAFDSVYMNNTTKQIRFRFSGRPGGDNSTFNIGKSDGTTIKKVVISPVGRVRSSTL